MKGLIYLAILLLIIPIQSALFNFISVAGIKPDLPLALIYIIGLLTGPTEASLAGMAIGLVQDIGSANLLGMNAFTRCFIGLGAGLMGRRVLDISSPMNSVFLAAFSLAEGIVILFSMQAISGEVPLVSLLLAHVIPQALYSGLLGIFLLRFMNRKNVMSALLRRSFLKE
jgi:rod shape-determining protein MreD